MKAYTDIEQSKKLSEILPIDSADMWYSYYGTSTYNPVIAYNGEQWFLCQIKNHLYDIPCWSLAALLEILPKIHRLKPILDLEEKSILYSGTNLDVRADNIIDACVDMILKLKERNLL